MVFLSDMVLLRDLKEKLACGDVLCVVGAGVSIGTSGGAKASSWVGLLRDGVERCMQVVQPVPSQKWREIALAEIESGDKDMLISAAEKITSKLNGPSGPEFAEWLRESVGALQVKDRAIIDALGALGVLIATTNYDSLLEEVLNFPAVTNREPAGFDQVLRARAKGVILHLHGWWKHPETVVLGIRSYDRQIENQHAQGVLRSLMMTKTLVFIGFGGGLTDPNFLALAQWAGIALKDSPYRRYRLVKDDEVDAITKEPSFDTRMRVIPYGANHEDLAPFLRSLAPARIETRDNPTTLSVKTGFVQRLQGGDSHNNHLLPAIMKAKNHVLLCYLDPHSPPNRDIPKSWMDYYDKVHKVTKKRLANKTLSRFIRIIIDSEENRKWADDIISEYFLGCEGATIALLDRKQVALSVQIVDENPFIFSASSNQVDDYRDISVGCDLYRDLKDYYFKLLDVSKKVLEHGKKK